MKTITIRLTAPLQSYGNQATFNQRTSGAYPSKSAVLGMIAAALGYRRDDKRISELNNLKFAVRIDQTGTQMTDFQTVEYHKSASKTARKLTYRQYLQDAVFVVALGSDNDTWIDEIYEALRKPKFQLYLGRRSNPPAGVLKMKIFENASPVEVLEKISWQASEWFKKRYKKNKFATDIVADADMLPDNPTSSVKDVIGSFDEKDRYYMYRQIACKQVELENSEFKDAFTDHDIWSCL
ncbi:type I-E CRISPR-associated protein Cas5/CasD [Lactobacillus hamsteri]|uniref:CRISPR-associated protein n=1 Tax=Lactobacillus hamsteri DSM 5661 = JCM 6256 TaxID=1423754 RepID=A0A0R1Y767_9LACO|nr:type I-E CRISPR-associated protein Cas5/CasD [Lactobacillus hamsteri]KRM38170.1 CRISPR-associated protein [Lactobacillus hamsteri DSM 5661 = JCM 6256]